MKINSRRKGLTYEREVRQYLESIFPEGVVRERNRSGFDGDDLHVAEFSVEIKNCATMDLSGWLKQAEDNCPVCMIPVVLHKKRGTTNIGKHYVTMSAEAFLYIVQTLIKRREP